MPLLPAARRPPSRRSPRRAFVRPGRSFVVELALALPGSRCSFKRSLAALSPRQTLAEITADEAAAAAVCPAVVAQHWQYQEEVSLTTPRTILPDAAAEPTPSVVPFKPLIFCGSWNCSFR
ncbi:MAG: hypothetical protein BJ554DRAFT_7411 [Olpidium bornovanus]|uniref:Uncharacterized protein n=1 Tax=Olpidium bornovanus TaxID=278681 RepID=A0A8H7ZW62_9FUNG|nr:MAG: hypothetical protein BJ554DRAFT_7411 [Olpidium bornovanus]